MSAQREDNARGVHAVRVLAGRKDFTLESLITAAYDSQLPAFEQLLPPLVRAHAALPDGERKRTLTRPIATLAAWNMRFGVASIAMTLADAYGIEVMNAAAPIARAAQRNVFTHIGDGHIDGDVLLGALERAIARLERDFGSWQVPWGVINRFQRVSGDIDAGFDDSKPSLPVAIASATWGSLAAYGQTGVRTTKKYYGNRGNSFVAAVEFGPRVRAKSVLAGGVSNNSDSPYFFNQGEPYATGTFKDVNFYRDDVVRHAVRTYRPGQP
jgi:acyl-homoserine-lactone acylase